MKKAIFALMMAALLALSGCVSETDPEPTALPPMESEQVTSRDELYELYNQIDFNMTIAELEETLGPAVREEVSMDDSTGTTLIWERNGIYTQVAVTDGQIVGKAISANDPRTLSLLTLDANFDNVHILEADMNYTEIVELMGCEGLEMLARINRDESPVTVNRLMRWTDNETGSVMQILFNQDGTICSDDNSYALYEFPTIEPGATYAPTPTADPNATPRPTAILTAAPVTELTQEPSEEPTETTTSDVTEVPVEAAAEVDSTAQPDATAAA